jgi:hypothetical protein
MRPRRRARSSAPPVVSGVLLGARQGMTRLRLGRPADSVAAIVVASCPHQDVIEPIAVHVASEERGLTPQRPDR